MGRSPLARPGRERARAAVPADGRADADAEYHAGREQSGDATALGRERERISDGPHDGIRDGGRIAERDISSDCAASTGT
jgi:hypothetical protein